MKKRFKIFALIATLILGLNNIFAQDPSKMSVDEMYSKGLEYDKAGDAKSAAEWFTKAAEKGSPSAQFNLGVCYRNGKGVEKNYTEAMKWYKKAAAQGHANAKAHIGYLYVNGLGVDKNFDEAWKWYKQAAESGSAMAQTWIGGMYYLGQGVAKNEEEGIKWIRKAADQGYTPAIDMLKKMGK